MQEARVIEDDELLHPLDAHKDVTDALRHDGADTDRPADDREEWEVYDEYQYESGGEY